MKIPARLPYLLTGGVLALAFVAAVMLYERALERPWTRDGQVQANVVGIAPRVSGPIVSIPLRDNQAVKKGDFLFEIDPATYQAAVDVAKGQLAVAQADFTRAEQDLQRQTALYQTRVIDEKDYQDSQDAFAAAKAALAAATANLQTAELNLGYTKIFAPVDGFITNFNISPGTYVSEGSELFALVDSSSFWVAGYFKETQIAHVREGDRVSMTLMGHWKSPFEGRVESTGWGIFVENGNSVQMLPAVQQTVDWVRLPNRFPVRVKVAGKPPVPLRIGQTVSVSVLPQEAGAAEEK